MNPSREYLQACSIQTGYQVAPLEKVVRLGEMAGDITRHPFLGKMLALKGGTVLNLCFGPPKRLSVDLDYNYIGNHEREKMLEDRPRVEEAICELSGRRGYHPQRSADSFAGRKIFLSYRSVMGQDDRIEVDLNYISSGSRLLSGRSANYGNPAIWIALRFMSLGWKNCLWVNWSPSWTVALRGTFGMWQIFQPRRWG